MNALLGAFGGIATILAAWFGYLAIRRQRSGSVRTSEAGDLWKAVEAHNERVTKYGDRLEKEVELWRGEATVCRSEMVELRREVADVHTLRAEVARLKVLAGE